MTTGPEGVGLISIDDDHGWRNPVTAVCQSTGVNPLTNSLSHSSTTGTTPDHILTLGRYSGYSLTALHHITGSFLASTSAVSDHLSLIGSFDLLGGARSTPNYISAQRTGLPSPQAQPSEHGTMRQLVVETIG